MIWKKIKNLARRSWPNFQITISPATNFRLIPRHVINLDKFGLIWKKLCSGRGPIWHREGYYYVNYFPSCWFLQSHQPKASVIENLCFIQTFSIGSFLFLHQLEFCFWTHLYLQETNLNSPIGGKAKFDIGEDLVCLVLTSMSAWTPVH